MRFGIEKKESGEAEIIEKFDAKHLAEARMDEMQQSDDPRYDMAEYRIVILSEE